MCGRYIIFTSEEYQEMKAILKEISRQYKVGTGIIGREEIFPTDDVPAVYSSGSEIGYGMFKWGFELPGTKRAVINARSESLGEKRMFSGLLDSGRCLLPANGFFEWNDRQKYFIKPADLQTFYMAGLYDRSGRTVIITAPACSDMIHIHDRMPVIFNKETGRLWLEKYDNDLLVPYEEGLEIKKAV
ncbi:MAG: SOS response-associated peptidase [Clostridia bacterium]|nr:SOS response-associated peptidase [Clostridia bacterium]